MAGDAESTREGSAADHIRLTERERLRALVEANIPVARQLHADDFQLVTPTGRILSKEQYLGAVASGDINYFVWEPDSEIEVRLYGEVVLIRYRSHMVMGDDKQKTVLHCRHIDAYEQRDGRRQVVWSQATEIR